MSAPAGAWFERPGGAYVMDTDTHNAIGYYRTEDAALSDVAEIVAEHGRDSAEARNLVMYCDGSGDSSIGGDALIARALDRARLTKSRPDH